MSSRLMQGDVFDVLPAIKPGSVDCCVTSPPYWMLRSYLAKDHPLKSRELGSEKTPAEFVKRMVKVFDLVRDCLADHGTCWVNIGDTYLSGDGSSGGMPSPKLKGRSNHVSSEGTGNSRREAGIESGNLCLIPQRLTIALQDAGWIVRSVIIWHKPAPMPASLSGWQWRRCRVKAGNMKPTKTEFYQQRPHQESESTYEHHKIAEWKDCPGCKKCEPTNGYVLRKGSWRPTSSYEPVLMLAKSSRYFADGEPVKTPPKEATVGRDKYSRVLDDADEQFAVKHDHETLCDGANLRDVWTIAAEALREKHYAAFPTALVEKCLRAGTSAKGYCPGCGAPWVRVVETEFNPSQKTNNMDGKRGYRGLDDKNRMPSSGINASQTIGWRASCPHTDAEPRPGLVLDPFSGSGRTAITAQQLGLDFVGCELNPEYADMARRLIREDMPLFAEVGHE